MDNKKKIQVVLIVGKSNFGKTTLMGKMIRELSARGFRVGSVKHAHDTFNFDKQGKDSCWHKNAGAVASLIVTDTKVALVKEDARPAEEKSCFGIEDTRSLADLVEQHFLASLSGRGA